MALIGISGKMQSGKNTVADIIQYLTHEYETHGQILLSFEKFMALKFEQDAFDWKQRSFAGKVKEVCSILTGIPVEDFEKQEVKDRVLGEEWDRFYFTRAKVRNFSLRHNEYCWENNNMIFSSKKEAEEQLVIVLKAIDDHSPDWWEINKESITVRQLLQQVGTDAMRNVIHPNVWVNALFSEYVCIHCGQNPCGIGHKNVLGMQTRYPSWIITDTRFPNEAEAILDRDGFIIRVNRNRIQPTDNPSIKIALDYTRTENTITDHSTHSSETALDNFQFSYVIDNNGTIEELIEKVKIILTERKII